MPTSITGPATGLDINAYRGDTFERWIRIKRNGVEEDLQPSTFRVQIRNGAILIRELSSPGEIQIEIAGGGVLYLQMTAAVMAELLPGTYTYDVQQTYPSGKVKTRFRGSFTITDDITKPIS